MVTAVPWQFGAEPGSKRARVLTPEMVVDEIKRSKRPLLVAGSRTIEKEGDEINLISYAVDLGKTLNAPVVVSPGIISQFNTQEYQSIIKLGAVDLINNLIDLEWMGFDDNGNYDLVIFLGGLYYFQNLILSSLKNFSQLKTLTLDRFYHPNATYSLQNLPEKRWVESLKFILDNVKGGQNA